LENLRKISYTGLVDMLAEYTTKYLHMMSEGSTSNEITACKETIDNIVEEIKSREDITGNNDSP